MDSTYSIAVNAICTVAVCVNLLFLLIFFKVPINALVTYKIFFVVMVIQDLVSSISFAIMSPRAISTNYVFVFVATGPLRHWRLCQALLLVYSMTFIMSLVLVMNNFVYQYIQVCKSHLVYIYTSPKWFMLMSAINTAIVFNWIAMIYFSCWPTAGFVDNLGPIVLSRYRLDVQDVAFLGLSVLRMPTFAFALFVEAFLLVAALGAVGSHCALGIHLCLKRNSMSLQSKKMQQQMFTMLLFESACPALCLHAPLVSIYLLVFTGIASPPVMSYMIGILMASFPLFCPLVVILVMKEYRRFFSRIFGLQKPMPSPSSVVLVEGKTCTTTMK